MPNQRATVQDSVERTVIAFNYATDHDNRIHSDDVAKQFGFRGGLVPGVGDYAYMARAAQEFLGDDWLDHGLMEAKFVHPVYDGETVVARAIPERSDQPNKLCCTLELVNSEGKTCAIGSASCSSQALSSEGTEALFGPLQLDSAPLPAIDDRPPARLQNLPVGTVLGSVCYSSEDTENDYQLAPARFVESAPEVEPGTAHRRLHPAIVPELGNQLLMQNTRLGPWIHTASRTRHIRPLSPGASLEARAVVAKAWEKKGREFVELQAVVFSEGQAAAELVHTAIIHLG